eukprot:Seg1641.20 transcript_id=Seg1641.20/GoldUCD/mRNA.D3Y31 product="N-terminal Xaa-Pro-Lys N-methyltransferase 1" protein_id=Seg1641.20/GoldUCD/D3Y31
MDPVIKRQMAQREKWYGDAVKYWQDISADMEGMLGGYEKISPIDIEASRKFLKELKKRSIWDSGNDKTLDCGAGIGRVAKHLLVPLFKQVDLVEQNSEFLEAARTYLGDSNDVVNEFFAAGLQDFKPKDKSYDVIWLQWVVGHLTEDDFVSCLKRFKQGLKPGGVICIKDNVASVEAIFDDNDSSVTRTHDQYIKIFKASGLNVRLKETQRNLPKELYKVNMYALS